MVRPSSGFDPEQREWIILQSDEMDKANWSRDSQIIYIITYEKSIYKIILQKEVLTIYNRVTKENNV